MEFLAAFLVFAVAIVGMAIGVILSRKRLKGSCGGLASLRDEHGRTMCEACTNPSPECTGENADQKSSRRGKGSLPEANGADSVDERDEEHATAGGNAAR